MPIERDQDAERQARIDEMLRHLGEVQDRVERMAADGRSGAAELQTRPVEARRDPAR